MIFTPIVLRNSPEAPTGDPPRLPHVADAVEVEDLTVTYGSRIALRGLAFTAATGAVTALLGRNGAGKTTLIECCEGLRAPDSGRIRILGQPARDPVLRARVGAMLQDGGIYATATARMMLGHLARLYATPWAPDDLIASVGMSGRERTPYRRLSGGEQQRMKLACALVGRPELVFLDEPTSGLDAQGRLLAWDLIAALRSAGVSVVLSTHHLEEAERLADSIAIMNEGRVERQAPLDVMIGDQSSITFRASAGMDTSGLDLLLGGRTREAPAGTYRIEGQVGATDIATVSAWCTNQGVVVRDLAFGRRTLEDVFLEVTGAGAS